MVRNIQKKVSALIALMLCVIMIAPTSVFATEYPSVELEASVTLEGMIPEEAEDYVLKIQDEAGTIQSITIRGEGTGTFPAMEFTKVGIYRYTIWQEAGTHKTCEYDDSIYHVTVTVTNEENGDGLETAVAAYKDDDTEKSAEIAFNNVYPGKDLPQDEDLPPEEQPADPEDPAKDVPDDEHVIGNDPSKPDTGDHQNIVWYLTLMTVSVLLLVVLRSRHE